jgi:hypothetical protein
VDYLFVDEVSAVWCEMLHNLSIVLAEAKGIAAAFGGVIVVFAGGFSQLPPIGDVRLYKNVDTRCNWCTSERSWALPLAGATLIYKFVVAPPELSHSSPFFFPLSTPNAQAGSTCSQFGESGDSSSWTWDGAGIGPGARV